MNAITLIWRQVLKELKLFQMKENKEDAVEKTDKEPQKTLKCHEDKYTVPLPDAAPPTGKEKETERKQPVRLTQEVRTFLQKQYDFRYNLLTEETEYRPANKRAVPFEPVSKRELNTFCMEAHDQGISCWDKDLSRYIYSTCIPEYHPFRLYMEELPGWDGTDIQNLIVSGYLSYYPFTARYKRNDLSCYKTTDKRNHCDTWYSGNSGKRQCIFEHSHPQSEPEYVHKIHTIAKFRCFRH